MSQTHVTHLLTDFMDETLAWQPTEKVKAHLAFCNACRQALNSFKSGIALLRQTPEATPSSDLERRITDWMSVERAHPASQEWRAPAWMTRRVTRQRAIFIAIATVIGFLVTRAALREDALPPSEPPSPRAPKDGRGAKIGGVSAAASLAAEARARAEMAPPMEGAQSGITDPMERLVKSESGWQEVWLRHHSRADRVPPLPDVDFEKNQVVAIFAGQKPTGGYRVQIVSISEGVRKGEKARIVRYKVPSPPKNALTAQVISQPFILRVIPRFQGPTFFEKSP